MAIASRVSVTEPIWFSLMRMEFAMPRSMPMARPFGVGDENIVADKLDLRSQRVGHDLPAIPVVLGHPVFDGDDRVLAHPVGVKLYQLLGSALALVGFLKMYFFFSVS